MALKPWRLRDRDFGWGQRTYLMGVLNVTPDSFSDGGEFNTLEAALQQATLLLQAGTDILDIGGQSTRPNAEPIELATELDRVIPVIQALRQDSAFAATPISVDTSRAAVAAAAIAAGADLINDISGGRFEPEIFSVVAQSQVPIVLMHSRGTPQTMQTLTDYTDLLAEIQQFLAQQIQRAIAAGVKRHQIMIDPGIGFAKTTPQNLEILRRLGELRDLGHPMLLGVSRKRFIGELLNQSNPKQRLFGTAAACVSAIVHGVDMVRVHDVAAIREACQIADVLWRS